MTRGQTDIVQYLLKNTENPPFLQDSTKNTKAFNSLTMKVGQLDTFIILHLFICSCSNKLFFTVLYSE